ncbi:MAG TPA: 2-oxoacid:acceptor oxidoreductase family protein [Bacillota bacterium]|nr:2-oxoacid:acceptor oxidoreductase family protein [Bacillota bacterium]HPF42345.1 2-oxoacid:acceptor oxidoreductase family protein [Bacillota bacterium]HPJ85320.1 2-oxoacid:acceptor oxidoreductase family protein [Bacillota bacterium]HPQ61384.1 2-oxoacid:acceptor oxidoreductase family protein [Bacillota bacterium]
MNETKNIKVAGFGGQGIMMFGQMIAYSATHDNVNSLWFPSYGPETRGGTANCSVIVSDKEINSPIFKDADHLVAFNAPSLEKFKDNVKKDGLVLYNSSMIPGDPGCKKGLVVGVPINDIATDLGNMKVANMVMLGAYLELTHLFPDETIKQILIKFLGQKKAHLLDINMMALASGKKYVADKGIKYA